MNDYNWQQKGWPHATCRRAALRDVLKDFETAFKALRMALKKPQDPEVVARAMADEAVKTSAIEGVVVDEINEASRSLDWTNWAAFFIPLLTELLTGFVAAGRIEYRGSKKTGGYFAL